MTELYERQAVTETESNGLRVKGAVVASKDDNASAAARRLLRNTITPYRRPAWPRVCNSAIRFASCKIRAAVRDRGHDVKRRERDCTIRGRGRGRGGAVAV